MQPGYLLRASGLVLAGFLSGIIVAGLNQGTALIAEEAQPLRSGVTPDYAATAGLEPVATTKAWDVLLDRKSEGRRIALAQNGQIRVVIHDDRSALHVFTYKSGDPVWQGRLMDVGNDGTIEVADISFGHCESFN